MENTGYVALSRQMTLQRQLDVVASNMANMNTPGYKADEMMFREYLTNTRSTDKAVGGKVSFVQDNGMLRNTIEGPLTSTGNTLDFALKGDGYFQVETEAGMRYTRNGHFSLDNSGMLVTSSGATVMDTSDNPIVFAPSETRISVAGDGTVSTENGVVAHLKVVRFANEQEMRRVGDSMYDTSQDAETISRPQVVQGMMEESNVSPVVEITKMTQLLRDYQAAQKVIENEHERQLKAIEAFVPKS